MHGGLQGLAGQQETACRQEGLTQHDGDDDAENGHDVLTDEGDINHHTYRHEEDGAKEVLDGVHEVFDLVCLDGLSEDAAHDEGAEGRGEAYGGGEDNHTEAETQGNDEQRLVAHQGLGLA